MITNERQLQTSKGKIANFKTAQERFRDGIVSDLDPLLVKAQGDALAQQIKELEAEVQEYEDLKEGRITAVELNNLADLPDGLIRARIAANLTQKDLADRLGMKEQQIQRYEVTRYESCSFARLVDIANAIGVRVSKRLEFHDVQATLGSVLKRLNLIGLDTNFLKTRIDRSLGSNAESVARLSQRVADLFDWSKNELTGDQAPEPPGLGAAMARFKMPRGRDARTVAVYTAYAHKLASICANAVAEEPKHLIPSNWQAFRRAVIERYGQFDLPSVAKFAWDCGIVVLPLNDSGAFHGATWRFTGRNVVILKQRTQFSSRWLADLLHELYHTSESPELPEFEVVELPETSEERRNSPSENAATLFAGDAALSGRAEELTKACVNFANGKIPALKEAVKAVARRENIEIGILANYIAYRLSLQNVNWWGTAANLQNDVAEPLGTLRDVFFERFRFDRVSAEEFQLLSLALNDGD